MEIVRTFTFLGYFHNPSLGISGSFEIEFAELEGLSEVDDNLCRESVVSALSMLDIGYNPAGESRLNTHLDDYVNCNGLADGEFDDFITATLVGLNKIGLVHRSKSVVTGDWTPPVGRVYH